jgi:hypothetical protein
MKKLSEKEKNYFREVFEEKNSIIEFSDGYGWEPITTKDKLECVLNSTNYLIHIIEIKPYSNINEFLDKQKSHGPYLIPINIEPKVLKYPIEVKDDGVSLYNGYWQSSEFVKYEILKKYYTWQDGYPCGKF